MISLEGVITGTVVSIIETTWLALDRFPDESITDHMTSVLPTPKNSGASLVIEIISPLSVAVASPRSMMFWSKLVASISISVGICKDGDVVSTIVTFCSILDSFPATSVAVHVTIVSPIGKNSGASLITETTPDTSVADGACNWTIFFIGTAASRVLSWICDITGGKVSTTCISCMAKAELPLLSTAVHIIWYMPNENDFGELLINNLIPLSSIAIASPISTCVKLPVDSITKSFGTCKRGFVISWTNCCSGSVTCSVASIAWSTDSMSLFSDSSVYDNSFNFSTCCAVNASSICFEVGVSNFTILFLTESTTKRYPFASIAIPVGSRNWFFSLPAYPNVFSVLASELILTILCFSKSVT